MKKEKSKILKLKKKLNRMEWLEKHLDKFLPLLMGIFMLSGIGFAFAWIFKIFPMFITCTSLMFVSSSSLFGSIAFSAMYNQNKCELIEKIEKIREKESETNNFKQENIKQIKSKLNKNYSRTKVAKIYAEKSKEQQEENQEDETINLGL